MKKVFSLGLICFFSIVLMAQTVKSKTSSVKDLNKQNDLLDSLDKPQSYFDLSFGIGNTSFSVNNNAVNASQSLISKLYFTPTIGYFHKNGFGISIAAYLSNENRRIKNFQTAITPSFDYESNSISTGISFSKFITDTKSYNSNSTYQNDLYGYLQYTKRSLQPILSIGYSSGVYNDISFDTLFGSPPNFRILNIRKDSTKNVVKDFSLSFGVEHTFNFDSLFTNDASLTFTPQLVLNAGSEKFTSTITNTNRIAKAKKNNRLKSLSTTDNVVFDFQSLALSLTAEYAIGNFILSPNLYLDYYLPTTIEKRLSSVFSLTLGYSFY